MTQEEIVAQEDIETPEEVREDNEQAEETTEPDERDAKIKDLEDRNKKLYARLKRDGIDPETGEIIKPKKVSSESPKNDSQTALSNSDLIALVKADVTEESDIEMLKKDAALLGVSIAEALKNSIVADKLKREAEKRNTANSANTRQARTGAKKTTDSELLGRLSKGDVPEAGSAEAEQIFWARRGGKK